MNKKKQTTRYYQQKVKKAQQEGRKRRFYLSFGFSLFGFLLSFMNLLAYYTHHNDLLSPGRALEIITPPNNGAPIAISIEIEKDDDDKNEMPDDEGPDFSACLIWMDDNHFMAEWFAYHYFVLRLRHVVIAPDPHAKTSPDFIVERWKGRMKVEIWNTTRYFNDTGLVEPLKRYLTRQKHFNTACLRHLKQLNKNWVIVADVDEYTYVNPAVLNNSSKVFDPSLRVPSIKEPGSVPDFLAQLKMPQNIDKPCVKIQRRQYAPIDTSDKAVNVNAPEGFQAADFQTLRWDRWGYRGDQVVKWNAKWGTHNYNNCGKRYIYPVGLKNIHGKVVIDLSRLSEEDLYEEGNDELGNPHRPLANICPEMWTQPEDSVFLIANHYTGTLEQWMYRQEVRSSSRLQKFTDFKDWYGKVEDDRSIQAWLPSFFNFVGKDEAMKLLAGAGEMHPFEGHYQIPELTEGRAIFQTGDEVQVGRDTRCNGDSNMTDFREAVVIGSAPEHGQYKIFYLDKCETEWPVDELRIRHNESGAWKC